MCIRDSYLIYHDDESETEDYRYKYATGLKTGQTPKAGSCLVATGEKDGQKLIALVYGDESEKGAKRWSIAKYLLEFGFTNYESFSMEELAEKCAGMTVTVGNAAENDEGGGVLAVQPVAGDDDTERVTLTTDQVNAGITATVTPKEGLAAPISEGESVGTVSLTVEGQEIFSGQVEAMRAVYSQEQVDKGPVSYTHLDVYKRQLPVRLTVVIAVVISCGLYVLFPKLGSGWSMIIAGVAAAAVMSVLKPVKTEEAENEH